MIKGSTNQTLQEAKNHVLPQSQGIEAEVVTQTVTHSVSEKVLLEGFKVESQNNLAEINN